MHFGGALRLEGEVQGGVHAIAKHPGTLVIGKKGRLDGEVSVAHLVVDGTINGTVRATGSLELLPSARVSANVYCESMGVRQGAILEGQLTCRTGSAAMLEVSVRFASGAERGSVRPAAARSTEPAIAQ